MTTEAPKKPGKEWLILLPDQQDALSRRMEVRPQHLSNLKPRVDSSFWVMGGAMLEEHPAPGSPPKIKGSVMMAVAETKEEVLEALKEDVYMKNNVWDWDKVEVIPFISAIRKELPPKI